MTEKDTAAIRDEDTAGTAGTEDTAGTEGEAGAAGSRRRRRGIAWALTAATLTGALLGAGAVGWRTGTLPFQDDRPCWGALSDETLDTVLAHGDRRPRPEGRREVEEQKLLGPGWSARCRVLVHSGEEHRQDKVVARLDVSVRTLDSRQGRDAQAWTAEFLSPEATPLGGGLRGTASRSRAWLALPQGCVDGQDPVVVEARIGAQDAGVFVPSSRRYGLTRAVVETANGLMGAYGCAGRHRVPEPPPALEESEEREREKKRDRAAATALCGLAGAPVPDKHVRALRAAARNWVDGGPVRVCGDDRPEADLHVRLMTVTDPALARIFERDASHGGPHVDGDPGHGTLTADRAVYTSRCQTGDVAFVVEWTPRYGFGRYGSDWTFVRDVFPLYVAAEADRLGCGPQKVTVPRT
ncbi:hypothetical protein [Streptomyces fradiae]|uniref:hypothetical protein n=1 Tax=Streptomyces fradiae TaxID=1906 RepID=UPI0029437519|nr:hypothetical protein [Streptomyces fradiae]WOI59634.1 hypothetical protein RYQ63_06785 [Streptomyces fradiae]